MPELSRIIGCRKWTLEFKAIEYNRSKREKERERYIYASKYITVNNYVSSMYDSIIYIYICRILDSTKTRQNQQRRMLLYNLSSL